MEAQPTRALVKAYQLLNARGFTLERNISGKFELGVVHGWSWDETARLSLLELGPVHALSISDRLIGNSSQYLFSLPKLNRVEMQFSKVSMADWENLSHCAGSLEELNLAFSEIPLQRLNLLDGLPQLHRLRLEFWQAGEDAPSYLPPVLDVPTIDSLRRLEATYYFPIRVQQMPNVEGMNLSVGPLNASNTGAKQYITVQTCPKLRRLRLDNSQSLSGIAEQPQLTDLRIERGSLTLADVRRLSHLGSLRSLSLDNVLLTREAVQALNELDELEELELAAVLIERPASSSAIETGQPEGERAELDDLSEIIEAIRRCTRLSTVRLVYMEFSSPVVLTSLSTMRQLKKLDLSGARASWKPSRGVAASDIPNLQDFNYLTELVVATVDVTKDEVKASLPKTNVSVRPLVEHHPAWSWLNGGAS